MAAYILTLSDPNATLETVGGKGMSLAKLLNANLPVPAGFHITTDAYRQFVACAGIQEQIMAAAGGLEEEADPQAIEAASHHILGLFAAGEIPAEIVQAVASAYESMQNAPVAVRSSATAEDLPGASFAGQQETYLNIRGTAAVLEAVKRCWASLWTARAIAYRIKNRIDPDTVALAVVVQELVDADAAGILFTANPINGRRSELVINAAWGLGEAVVSGAVTPDMLVVDKASRRILQRETAEKAVMTVRTDRGTQEVPVPAARKKMPALTGSQAAQLVDLAVRIEDYYQMPMDIEWALADGKIAILQARPITALPESPVSWELPDRKAVYARSSLAEHVPSPVTPLFSTLGLEIANQATLELWGTILGEKAQEVVIEGGFYQVLNGYVYGGIHMGPADTLRLAKMSLAQIAPMFKGSVPRWEAARKELAAVVDSWEQKQPSSLTASELLEGVRVLFVAACHYFTVIQTCLPAASSSEVIFSRFYEKLVRGKQDSTATTFLLGFETAALRSEKSLYDLAGWIKTSPLLAGYMLQTPTPQLVEDLKVGILPDGLPANLWGEWRSRFQAYLDEFGRTAYEFDFAWPTPAEAPEPLLDALKAYVDGKASNPYERQRETVEKREQATQAVRTRIGWPRKDWFEKLLHWAQETGPMREDAIFDMGMGHPVIRRLLGELGCRLTAGGAIRQAEDIYWLEKSELEQLIEALESHQSLADHSAAVSTRRAQWQAQQKLSPPVMLPEKSGWSRFVHGAESEEKDGKLVLKGVGTSSGMVTAPAQVLHGPEDFGSFQRGDVLVAVTTTPAWTPLFALASAVVTDIGGPLSHSSIVAREYGIPAVMAARQATHLIQSGQKITVDGSAGTVVVDLPSET